jgi:hypothetical protein
VACTEGGADTNSIILGGGSSGGGSTSATKAKKSGQEVSELLSKLVTVLESRNDISNNSNDDHQESSSSSISVHELPTLSKTKATSLANSTLRHLLGGETSDAHLAYRGDKHLATEPLLQWAMGYFFSADPSYRCESDDTCGMYGLESGTLSSHLALDRTASEAIHLLPPRSGSGAALITGGNMGNNSLFGVLNHCKTKMGR